MTEARIKHMVDRFLGWRLPDDFNPDGGIAFERYGNKGTLHQYRREPSGTNLLDADQAEKMVRHMVEGLVLNENPGEFELTLIKPCVEEHYLAQLTELVNQGWTIAGTGVTQPTGNFAYLYSATLIRAVQVKALAA